MRGAVASASALGGHVFVVTRKGLAGRVGNSKLQNRVSGAVCLGNGSPVALLVGLPVRAGAWVWRSQAAAEESMGLARPRQTCRTPAFEIYNEDVLIQNLCN